MNKNTVTPFEARLKQFDLASQNFEIMTKTGGNTSFNDSLCLFDSDESTKLQYDPVEGEMGDDIIITGGAFGM